MPPPPQPRAQQGAADTVGVDYAKPQGTGTGTMRGCELLWGPERADVFQTEFEAMEGGPCPCFVGQACPVLPRQIRLRVVTADDASTSPRDVS